MPSRTFSLPAVPSVSLPHWNYFLAIENDIGRIGRYIELTRANFTTYSIETARLLMAATQESMFCSNNCVHTKETVQKMKKRIEFWCLKPIRGLLRQRFKLANMG